MLIPSIDLLNGQIVQLVQGEKLKLAFDDFDPWIERFAKYPLVQLIDLDAAMRQGSNASLIEHFTSRLPCQVGGGLRTAEDGQRMLDLGAKRVIYGSTLFGGDVPADRKPATPSSTSSSPPPCAAPSAKTSSSSRSTPSRERSPSRAGRSPSTSPRKRP